MIQTNTNQEEATLLSNEVYQVKRSIIWLTSVQPDLNYGNLREEVSQPPLMEESGSLLSKVIKLFRLS